MNFFVLEDDKQRIRDFYKRILELNQLGYSTSLAQTDNVKDAKRLLTENRYDILSLDHDLGGQTYVDEQDKNTGSELVRWLVKNPDLVKDSAVIIHSLNPIGARYMYEMLRDANIQAIMIPCVWREDKFHSSIQIKKDGGVSE